jgi:hypothetical protein
MNKLYKFPKAAEYGKIIAKNKIYSHSKPGTNIKDLFIKDVEKTVWSYKLSPETINIPARDDIHEIQVITIKQKNLKLSDKILNTIDNAIPSPVLFHLKYAGKAKYAISYKRQSKAYKNKSVLSSYLESDWINNDADCIELPLALNMKDLYHSILMSMSPLSLKKGETIESLISRIDLIQDKKKEAKKLRKKINIEKQYNRRMELNQILNKVNKDIESIKKI